VRAIRPLTERMHGLISHWEQAADKRRFFLICYTMMTETMLAAIAAEEFRDGPWVDELLHRFAGYYFRGLNAFEADLQDTPAVWAIAHRAAQKPRVHVTQHLFLGINAHINYDLVLTLVDLLEQEWPGLDEEQRAGRYQDYTYVNEIIAATIDEVQDSVVERLNPGLAVLDILGGRMDEWLVSQLINAWREEVWEQALDQLDAETPQERERLRAELEAKTLRLSEQILSLP